MEEPDTGQKNVHQRVKTGSARLREIRDQLAQAKVSKQKPTQSSSTTDAPEGMTTTTAPEVEILAGPMAGPEINEENILLENTNWTRINTDPPEFSTVRNLKMALGAIGKVINL